MTGQRAANPGRLPLPASISFRGGPLEEVRRVTDRLGLGFSMPELLRLREYFSQEGRDPTLVEIAGIAQSWSEHCSYKSSRPLLQTYFGRLPRDPRVQAQGDAGVVAIDDEYAYALRIESHNHPSAVEPYGGAATGIGGILRDVLAMGAKPVALADPLFFGPLDIRHKDLPPGVKHPRYLFDNIIAGIRDYGNRVGVPTVVGSISFDRAYLVNPLVNVGCVGILPRSRLLPNRARAPGDALVLVGGLTGRDGIGGVAFASRELKENASTDERGAVQLGNPIMKEPLIHACLEAADRRLIQGLKDLGGGGLATCSGEFVHSAGFGSRIDLERVPLREPDMAPWEIWVSESQERMLLDCRASDVPSLLRIFELYDVPATVVGRVTEGGRERIYFGRRKVGDLNLAFRIDPPPLSREIRFRRLSPAGPSPGVRHSLAEIAETFNATYHASGRGPVINLYDHTVQARTILPPLQGRPQSLSHGDASVLSVAPDRYVGLALSVGASPYTARLDASYGARAAVAEAARNLYAVGAQPVALTNCLNFGSPEDPEVMGDFSQTVEGIAEAARILEVSVPSGNVSFYNGGQGSAIPATAVILATGILDDYRRAVSTDLKEEGGELFLLGRTGPELGGSLYVRLYEILDRSLGPLDLSELKACGERLGRTMREGLVVSCHDVSEGGLLLTLCEMAYGGDLGFDVDLAAISGMDPRVAAVSESGNRWVVEVPSDRVSEFRQRMEGLPVTPLGCVRGDQAIFRSKEAVLLEASVSKLRTSWERALERAGPS